MQKVIIKIYIKKRIRPLCSVVVEDSKAFEELAETIDASKTVVKFGQIQFNKSEYRFATLTYK